MSIPEPDPIPQGEIVTIKLIEAIKGEHKISKDIKLKAIQLINERDEYGFKKYKQHLMSKDGRNTIEDARQELGDLFQYCFKAKMNGESLQEIKELIPLFHALFDDND